MCKKNLFRYAGKVKYNSTQNLKNEDYGLNCINLVWNLNLPHSCDCFMTITSIVIYWKLHPGQGQCE